MAREVASTPKAASINFSWPSDADGNPMALVTMQLSELVGLPNYSNVTVGPGSVTRFVVDTPEAVSKGLRDCAVAVEQILAEEREPVLQMVQNGS